MSKEISILLDENHALQTKVDELTAALGRLGSAEPFCLGRGDISEELFYSIELKARSTYAKAALKQEGE